MSDQTTADTPLLSAGEARILAVLVEKEATTPEQYPLTLNSLQLGCNQKSNREPLMQLELGEVGHLIRGLCQRGLAKLSHGARVERFEHRLDASYQLTRRKRAALAVLMLRGPQTINEIYTRADRLADFQSEEDVLDTLTRLMEREPPLVKRIGRASGQREDRFAQLLCGDVIVAETSPRAEAALTTRSDLSARVAELERLVEDLRGRLERLDSNGRGGE
jgi:hypothetical protein